METHVVELKIPEGANIVFGQSHFIKTVEDIFEIMVSSVPGVKFAVAFNEASGPRLVRFDGNDQTLMEIAVSNIQAVGAGHTFVVIMQEAFPINVLNAIKQCPEVCRIFAATANPIQVVVAETKQGRGVLGVIDGQSPLGVESNEDKEQRRSFLRTIGYKR